MNLGAEELADKGVATHAAPPHLVQMYQAHRARVIRLHTCSAELPLCRGGYAQSIVADQPGPATCAPAASPCHPRLALYPHYAWHHDVRGPCASCVPVSSSACSGGGGGSGGCLRVPAMPL